METIQFKFKATQARSIYHYKKLKIRVLKRNADIFFNKQCLTKKIIPNYANIKIPAMSPAAHKTQSNAQITQIKEEIKFLKIFILLSLKNKQKHTKMSQIKTMNI